MSALLKHSHLDVQIFESAAQFSERGAAVGIAGNAQAAMNEIGGPVADALDRAGGVVMSCSRLCMAAGPNTGDIIFELAAERRGKVVHRAALLAALLAPIPKEKMFTKKKVVKIEEAEDQSLVLHFSDGTTSTADVVVGADGVHGSVKEHVLGSVHPGLKPGFAGFWDARSLIPMAKAKELLGEEIFKENTQYGYVGDGGFFMHDILDGGETVQFVVTGLLPQEWQEDEVKAGKTLSREAVEDVMSKWGDLPRKKGIIEAMLQNPDLKAYPQYHHYPSTSTPTYSRGHACIMGDAAHCTTPWQGSGAGSAIEDAMILDTVLGHVKSRGEIEAALSAYDQTRRPRTQRLVDSSYGTGLILCGRGEDIGVDIRKLREGLPGRWAFIYGFDAKDHRQQAVEIMQETKMAG